MNGNNGKIEMQMFTDSQIEKLPPRHPQLKSKALDSLRFRQ